MTHSTRQFILAAIAAGDDNAAIIAAVRALPPTPKASGPATFVTYTLIGTRKDLFGPGAFNVAGALRSRLEAWCNVPDLSEGNTLPYPNPGTLQIIHDRLKGSTGLDLSNEDTPGLLALFASDVDEAHPALFGQEQALALLSIGYDIPDASDEEMDAIRAELARETRQQQAEAALVPYRDAWNAFNAALDVWVRDGGDMPTWGGGE